MHPSPSIEQLVAHLSALPESEREAAADHFWKNADFPLVDRTTDGMCLATFLWRDTCAGVVVGINRITNTLHDSVMFRVPGTSLWYRTVELSSTWRGSYHFLPLQQGDLDELAAMEPRWVMRTIRERGQIDPRNPHVVDTHGALASELAMPEAAELPSFPQSYSPPGCCLEKTAPSGRKVWLYSTPGSSSPRPLMIVLDGHLWWRAGYAAYTADNLAQPVHLLFVDTEHTRAEDFAPDSRIGHEIVDVLLPWARSLIPVSEVLITGESLGGLTAIKTALKYPQHIGAALGQSSSLWREDLVALAASAAPISLYLTAGKHEGKLTEAHHRFVGRLAETSHRYRYVEYDGGHDMAWWRGLWADGVESLLSP